LTFVALIDTTIHDARSQTSNELRADVGVRAPMRSGVSPRLFHSFRNHPLLRILSRGGKLLAVFGQRSKEERPC
jgi:hypothetical protein